MTKTLNPIIFFFLHQNQNIFFSNFGNQNIFLEEKHNTPHPPSPFKLNGRSLKSLKNGKSSSVDLISNGMLKNAIP
jgi:hypothetical protein